MLRIKAVLAQDKGVLKSLPTQRLFFHPLSFSHPNVKFSTPASKNREKTMRNVANGSSRVRFNGNRQYKVLKSFSILAIFA